MSSWVTPLRTNCASSWANYADRFDVQNVGSVTDTASTTINYNIIVICRDHCTIQFNNVRSASVLAKNCKYLVYKYNIPVFAWYGQL